MRRLKLIIGLLLVGLLGGVALLWHTQTRGLGDALVRDVAAAEARSIARVPSPSGPLHDNGYQCLGAMLDVTPSDLTPFSARGSPNLDEFISGARPVAELAPDVRARLQTLSPWATSMRGCASSMRLAYVEGLAPWTPVRHPRRERLAAVVPALIEFTALELRVLLSDGQAEVALERCTAVFAFMADQSHLGLLGALFARFGVRRLAPVCGEALAAAVPDVRTQVSKQWAPLQGRLAPAHELVELERLSTSLLIFAWVTSGEQRAQLPRATPPDAPDFKRRFRVERLWRPWDAAMRRLVEVADVPGPERDSAAAAIDASFSSRWSPPDLQVSTQYARFLTSYEETGLVLGLLAELAAGGTKPLPPGVTRTARALEYVNGQDQKLVIPLGGAAP